MSNTMRVVVVAGILCLSVVALVAVFGQMLPKNYFSSENRNSVASFIEPIIEVATFSAVHTEPEKTEPLMLLFGGDMMFDRNIRLAAQKHSYGFILEELQPLLQQHDLVIANLEGPITSFSSESVGSVPGSPKNFIFTFDPQVAATLKASNIQLVNLGNNHIQNFGLAGVTQTKEYLDAAHVQYFGNTGEDESVPRVTTVTLKGVTLGFVNYNQFAPESLERAVIDIAAIRNSVDLLVVYTHWGLEYKPEANEVIRNVATQLQTAGADLIIGSHPHVVQQSEDLVDATGKITRVYYSLGNMVFDQYFDPAVRQGLLVSVKIDPETLAMEFTEHAIALETSGQTVLMQKE